MATGKLTAVLQPLHDSLPACLSTLSLPTLLSAVLFVGLATRIIYLRVFHPLAGFPGPFWASITNLYSVYLFFTWRMEELEYELHQKYGPIIRIQPNHLSFSSPETLPVIYHRTADKDPDYYLSAGWGLGPSMFGALSHEAHVPLRRRLAPAFSMSSTLRLLPTLTARLTHLHQKLSSFAKSAETVDFAQWMEFAAYDTISQLTFGKPFGFVDSGKDVHGLTAAKEMGMPVFGLTSRFTLVGKVLALAGGALLPKSGDKEGIGAVMGVRDRMLKERLEILASGDKKKEEYADFLQFLIDARNADGTPMTRTEISDELLAIMLAGSDTISTTIRLILYRVLLTPGILARLQAELDDAAALSSPVPQYDELIRLAYFQAVIKEGLRLDPGGPIILPRMSPKEGYVVQGRYVPGGVKVGCNPFVVNRDKGYWGGDAGEFKPERWLEYGAEEGRRREAMLATWGYGSRVCIGKHLATVEVNMAVAMILKNFTPEIVDLEKHGRRRNMANYMQSGMWMRFHER